MRIVRALFALSAREANGVFSVEQGGAVSRLELERGYVHAMSNVGGAADAEAALAALLERMSPDARYRYAEDGARYGRPVRPFHPAGLLRRHVEAHGPARAPLLDGVARLTLALRPHRSCLEACEVPLVELLERPRGRAELEAVLAGPRLERLLGFLVAVGALVQEGFDYELEGESEAARALRVLGVVRGASPDEIRRAYHRRARELHPDSRPEADAATRRELAERFSRLTKAYRLLVPDGG